MKAKACTSSEAQKTVNSVRKSLSAEERDYWWKANPSPGLDEEVREQVEKKGDCGAGG